MDYKKSSLYLARSLYAFSVSLAVSSIADPTGSIFYPQKDFSWIDSFILFLASSFISALLLRFALRIEGARRIVDYSIIFFAVLFGVSLWQP